ANAQLNRSPRNCRQVGQNPMGHRWRLVTTLPRSRASPDPIWGWGRKTLGLQSIFAWRLRIPRHVGLAAPFVLQAWRRARPNRANLGVTIRPYLRRAVADARRQFQRPGVPWIAK